MSRRTLSDAQWARIEQLVPGKSTDSGRSGADNRLFVDAVLWMARCCAPWRDLPPEFGKWYSVHSRFRRWVLSGVDPSKFRDELLFRLVRVFSIVVGLGDAKAITD